MSNFHKTKILSFAFFALTSASPSIAQSLVEPGTCELIVASRPNFSAARAYIRANVQDTRFTKLFESSNGWYAISIGSLRPNEEQSVMQSWKASGRIPQDSLCSTGGNYVAEYNWRDGSLIASANSNTRQAPRTNTQQRANNQQPSGNDPSAELGLAIIGGALGLIFGGLADGGSNSSSSSSASSSCFWVQGDFTGGPNHVDRFSLSGPSNVSISDNNSSTKTICPFSGNGAGTYTYSMGTSGWDRVCTGTVRLSGGRNTTINVYYSGCNLGYVNEM
jgi:hypothetical protein